MKRRQVLVYFSAALLIIMLVLVGCDNAFRPVVNPIPQQGGVPATLKIAVVLSSTGSASNGFISGLDVSGDTNIGEIQVGHGPSSLTLGAAGETVYVANQTDSSISTITGFIPNTVSPLTLAESITNLPAGTLCQAPPCASGNPMVATANSLYVTQADPVNGRGSVVIMSLLGSPTLTGQIPIGVPTPIPPAIPPPASLPTQLISVPGINKVYSLNTNTSDLTSWNAQTNAVAHASIAVGSNPVSAVANTVGNRLFVANQNDGTVSVIDTANDEVINAGTDALPTAALPVGSQPMGLFLNDKTSQLFVANNGSNTVSVINVAVPLGTPNPPNLNPNPQFGQTTTVAIPGPGAPTAVVATNDGTRAFVLTVDGSNNAAVFEIGFIGNAIPVVSQIMIPTSVPPPFTAPVVGSYEFGISSDGTKVYLVFNASSRQTFCNGTVSAGPTCSGTLYIGTWPNVYTISTQNSTVTNTTNSIAGVSVPLQTPATPVRIAIQP